jgi:hypothetical protein
MGDSSFLTYIYGGVERFWGFGGECFLGEYTYYYDYRFVEIVSSGIIFLKAVSDW